MVFLGRVRTIHQLGEDKANKIYICIEIDVSVCSYIIIESDLIRTEHKLKGHSGIRFR